MWQAGEEVIQITSSGGDNVVNAKGRANEIGQSWCPADLFDFQLPITGTSQRPPLHPMQTHVA